MPRKQLIIIGIVWLLVIFMLAFCPSKSSAETFPTTGLSMSDWQKVVVGLEEDKICQQELQYIKDDRAIVESQNKLLKETIALHEELNKSTEKRITNLQSELQLQDAACKTAIKAAKPSFLENIGKAVIFMLIGGGIVFLL